MSAKVNVDADAARRLAIAALPAAPANTFAAQSISTATTNAATTTQAVTPPADPSSRLLPAAVGTATGVNRALGILTAAVNGFLSPFAAGAPAAPAEPPTLWTLLAWVRREFFNGSPTITPTINPQATST